MILKAGTRLKSGRYEIFELLSQGSLKKVYKAYDHLEKKWVAIKWFDPTQKGKDILDFAGYTLEQVFANEISVREYPDAGIIFENISAVRDAFIESDGEKVSRFLVEDLYNGNIYEIEELCRGATLPAEKAKDYLLQLLNSLKELSAKAGKSFHSDLKAQNVLLSVLNGRSILKLTDLTYCGLPVKDKNFGYPATTAPELLDTNAPATLQSDLWSLGMMYYQMRTGNYLIPFVQPSAEIWNKIPLFERIKRYDVPFKGALYDLGQRGVEERIGHFSGDEFAVNAFTSLLQIDPRKRRFI